MWDRVHTAWPAPATCWAPGFCYWREVLRGCSRMSQLNQFLMVPWYQQQGTLSPLVFKEQKSTTSVKLQHLISSSGKMRQSSSPIKEHLYISPCDTSFKSPEQLLSLTKERAMNCYRYLCQSSPGKRAVKKVKLKRTERNFPGLET